MGKPCIQQVPRLTWHFALIYYFFWSSWSMLYKYTVSLEVLDCVANDFTLLQVVKINVCYWKEKVPGSYSMKQRFPCFVQTECLESKVHIYGLPSNEYPGLMKVRHVTGPLSEVLHRNYCIPTSNIQTVSRK